MLVASALIALAPVAQPPPSAAPPGPPAASSRAAQPRLIMLPDDAVAVVPASAGPHPPLLVLLHGADHRPVWMLRQFADEADARGLVLLAPTSKGQTWDAVATAEAPPSPSSPLANSAASHFSRTRDVGRVAAAIRALEAQVPVDRSRVVLGGFSDGATFAVAMGLSRDTDFAAVIAWSPGIAIETTDPARGRRVIVAHGRRDRVLSYDVTCNEIVPMLKSEGGAVRFFGFDGGHEMPQAVKDAALDAAFGTVGAGGVPAEEGCR